MIPFFLSLVVLIFGSFVFQFFLPPVLLLSGAAILFVPPLYFYGCLSLPFPLMLGLTFITGLLNDLFMVPQAKGHADYTAGVSILVYLVPGLIMHGFKPLFLRHRWELHWLLAEISAALTPFILVAQYAILSVERTNFFFNDVIVWRILGPGLISVLIAPCVFFILTPLSHVLGYRPGLPLAR
jgi:hypothetical protein